MLPVVLLPCLGLFLASAALCAQEPASPTAGDGILAPADTAGAFMDAGAAPLFARARNARLATDRSLRSYTADVQSRAAASMRMPLKDRTLLRLESSSRVRWSRDAETVVQRRSGRVQTPVGVDPPDGGFESVFDPSQDRLYFGMMNDSTRDNDDFWIEHPLGEDAERHYRYQSGDTTTVRLQDGSVVRVIELRVIPRRSDPHAVRGVLWIDSRSGALVQAAFRLARKANIMRDMGGVDDEDRETAEKIPLINPMEFDITLMTVEYSLWDMKHWLPRYMRFEGMVRAGVMHFPASFDVSYRMRDVLTDSDEPGYTEAEAVERTVAEWSGVDHKVSEHRNGRQRQRVLTPTDKQRLMTSAELPPPIWSDAPGFASGADLKRIADRLSSLAVPSPHVRLPVSWGWGLGEPGMTRYNRVEALSIGARLSVPLPRLLATAETRLGAGDLHPNAAVQLQREGVRTSVTLRAFHELASAEPSRRAFGASNSLAAAMLGRDEGEYYRASGALLSVAPPTLARQSWQLSGYVEVQDDVERNTHVALPRLWTQDVFRPNIQADEATQVGALLQLRPWWGTDPMGLQAGLDVMVQGEAGDFEHVRGRVTVRAAAPLFAGVRLGVEAGAGTSTGDVPVQRLFFLGGASTLRGYEPSTVAGTSMARGRLELARTLRLTNVAVFSDWGWAGDRDDIRGEAQRWSVGAGVSLLDGLVRLDLARGLRAPRGWRLDLHLDSLL